MGQRDGDRRSDSKNSLTILDWIGLLMIVPAVLFLLAAPPFVTPMLAQMFAEFGSAASLPVLTRLVMSWWVPIAMAIVPIGLAALAIVGRGPLGMRRFLGVAAFLAAVAGVAVYFVGLYAPILGLADSIQ